MEDIIKQFETGLKAHLESTYNLIDEQDEIKKIDNIEKTVSDFVDRYLLETDLIAGDVAAATQRIVDAFVQSKINNI